jgi:hypothetical protein
VLIHLVDAGRFDRQAQVVDASRNGNPNDEGAIWRPGETFADTANQVTVQVLQAEGSGFQVLITHGPL